MNNISKIIILIILIFNSILSYGQIELSLLGINSQDTSPDPVIASKIQHATSSANPASATFPSAPTEGNLLIATSFHRGGETSPTISGSGWNLAEDLEIELLNTTYRRAVAVWWKIAGASEPDNIQTNWGGGITNKLVIQEFEIGEAGYTYQFIGSEATDNGQTDDATSITSGTINANDYNILTIGFIYVKDNTNNSATITGADFSNGDWFTTLFGEAIAFGRPLASSIKNDYYIGSVNTTISNITGMSSNRGLSSVVISFKLIEE